MRRLLKNNYQTPVLIVGLICVILLYLPIIILNKDAYTSFMISWTVRC